MPPEPHKAAVRRSLDVLDAFATGQVQTVASVCETTGLPPATAYRMLTMLIDWGGVEKVGRGRYRLGLKLWRLGSSVPVARQLRDVALPFLEDLYEATHEVVHLAVVDGLQTLYIEKISGRSTVPVTSRVGRRLPLHATGPGKVLLAFGPRTVLDEVLARELERRTAHTITDPAVLRRALAEIRKTGVAISRNEASMGTASVAAPVLDPAGTAVAAVSVVATADELKAPHLIPAVRAVARAISRQLVAAYGLSSPPSKQRR